MLRLLIDTRECSLNCLQSVLNKYNTYSLKKKPDSEKNI